MTALRDYDLVVAVALGAAAAGERMTPAVAAHFGWTHKSASDAISKARKRGHAIPDERRSSVHAAAGRTWTQTQDRQLRDFYAQYPAPMAIPVRQIADLLGKTPGAIRVRACVLGMAQPDRYRGAPVKHLPKPCAVCGIEFKPASATSACCSTSCGRVKAIADHGHPRGATGMKHTPEAKAAISANSKRMWANMSDAERERRADITRASAPNRHTPADRVHTRSKGGRRADLGGQYFRSRWEANYARWLNFRIAHESTIVRWTFEPRTFTFPVKRGTMSYTPDFLVEFADGRMEWHEVKGWLTQQGATALKRFAKYYPDEVLVLIDEAAYKAIAKAAKGLIGEWE